MLSEDPIRNGLNWYNYASNNPIRFIDPTGLYDRDAAVNYIVEWHDSHNPDYLAMDKITTNIYYASSYRVFLGMADCTNFTSQALLAGDISMNEDWHYYEHENKYSPWLSLLSAFGTMQNQFVTSDGTVTTSPIDYDFTGAWGLANQQYKYFSNPENGYINGSVINIAPGSQKDINNAIKDGVQVGDMLYWSWKGDGFINHSTMITEIRKDMILYGGHTRSQQYADLYTMLYKYPNAKAYIVKICDNAE